MSNRGIIRTIQWSHKMWGGKSYIIQWHWEILPVILCRDYLFCIQHNCSVWESQHNMLISFLFFSFYRMSCGDLNFLISKVHQMMGKLESSCFFRTQKRNKLRQRLEIYTATIDETDYMSMKWEFSYWCCLRFHILALLSWLCSGQARPQITIRYCLQI